MAALVLRSRAKTKHHLAAIDYGGRHAHYRRAHHHPPGERIMGFLEWVETAATEGYKELDRLSTMRPAGMRGGRHLVMAQS